MVTNTIPTMCSDRLRATFLAERSVMRTSEISGLLAVHTAGAGAALQGTRVSAAATTTSTKATALLPISDVVAYDGFAGCRAWSPPV